jgi:hypothetical protein
MKKYLIILMFTLSSVLAEDAPIKDGAYVRAVTGAVYKIDLGFKRRIPDGDTLNAFGIDPNDKKQVQSISNEQLDKLETGEPIPMHKKVSKKKLSEHGKKYVTVEIPEGWIYVSHSVKHHQSHGEWDVSIKRDPKTQAVLSVELMVEGHGRDVYGPISGKKRYRESTISVIMQKK